jgi:ribosomal protein S19E (S16A)
MSKERKFVDGIETISFIEGMVHLEWFNYIAGSQKQNDQRPDLEITEELIMTPRGFLRAFSAMQKLVKQLEQAGVVRKNEDNDAIIHPEVVTNGASSPNWSND